MIHWKLAVVVFQQGPAAFVTSCRSVHHGNEILLHRLLDRRRLREPTDLLSVMLLSIYMRIRMLCYLHAGGSPCTSVTEDLNA